MMVSLIIIVIISTFEIEVKSSDSVAKDMMMCVRTEDCSMKVIKNLINLIR